MRYVLFLFLCLFALIVNTASAQIVVEPPAKAETDIDSERVRTFLGMVDESVNSADSAGTIDGSAPVMILEHIEDMPIVGWGIFEVQPDCSECPEKEFFGYVEIDPSAGEDDGIRSFVSNVFRFRDDTRGHLEHILGWSSPDEDMLVVEEARCDGDCVEYIERGMQTFGVNLRKVNRFPWPPPEQESPTR